MVQNLVGNVRADLLPGVEIGLKFIAVLEERLIICDLVHYSELFDVPFMIVQGSWTAVKKVIVGPGARVVPIHVSGEAVCPF